MLEETSQPALEGSDDPNAAELEAEETAQPVLEEPLPDESEQPPADPVDITLSGTDHVRFEPDPNAPPPEAIEIESDDEIPPTRQGVIDFDADLPDPVGDSLTAEAGSSESQPAD